MSKEKLEIFVTQDVKIKEYDDKNYILMKLVKNKNNQTGEIKNTFHGLDRVVNAAHLALPQEDLNNMPGHNNGSLIAKMSYANAYGLISFSIQTR